MNDTRKLAIPRNAIIGISIVAALVALGGLLLWALGFHVVRAKGDPVPLSSDGRFEHDAFDELLDEIVVGEYVDYDALLQDPDRLHAYVARLEQDGPDSRPDLFADDADRLAYYINAYNALTLLGVVHHWPIDSVQEVSGLIDPKPGFGFFFAQRFRLDDDLVSLYGLENDIIRGRFDDARFHAAVNCASEGCPQLRADAYTGDALDEQLAEAATRFASDPKHVRVDAENEAVELSALYEWYAADFEAHASSLGTEPTVLAWIAHHASPEVATQIQDARERGFSVQYMDYDWSLNAVPSDGAGATTVDERPPRQEQPAGEPSPSSAASDGAPPAGSGAPPASSQAAPDGPSD